MSFSIRIQFLALMAVVMALLGIAGSASAGISSKTVDVAPAVAQLNITDSAVSPDGSSLIAWTQPDGVNQVLKLRRIQPDGTLGSIINVTANTTGVGDAKIAFAPNGRAVVVYSIRGVFTDPSSLKAVWIEPNDSLTPEMTVRNGGTMSDSGEISVTATSDNKAIAAWHNFQSTPGPFRKVETRFINADNTTGPLLMPTSAAGSTNVNVAANASGGALLAWREGTAIKTIPVSSASVLGTELQPSGVASGNAILTTDGSDHFRLFYRVGTTPTSTIFFNFLTADGTASLATPLFPAQAPLIGTITAETNSANRTLVTWTTNTVDGPDLVRSLVISNDNLPGPLVVNRDDSSKQSDQSGDIDAAGGGALAWLETTAVPNAQSVWGKIVPQSGNPPDPVELSAKGALANSPSSGLNPVGLGYVAWTQTTDDGLTRSVNLRQILPPPVCQPVSGTSVQGAPVTLDVSCTGFQILSPDLVTGPGHGKVAGVGGTSRLVYTPDPGYAGSDSFTFHGENPGGPGATLTASLTVGKDTVAPKIRSLKVKPKRVRKRGTVNATFSELATVAVKIERKKGRKFRAVGTLKTKQLSSVAKLKFRKKIGRKKLKPGSYRASAIAKDAAGNKSKVKRVKFKVKR